MLKIRRGGAHFSTIRRGGHYETFLVALGRRRLQSDDSWHPHDGEPGGSIGWWIRGDLRFTFYRNSPLIHAETVVTTTKTGARSFTTRASKAPRRAGSRWRGMTPSGKFQTVKSAEHAAAHPVAVAGRTIVASGSCGFDRGVSAAASVFLSAGRGLQFEVRLAWTEITASACGGCGFGIRQSRHGDKRFVPWFNAPPGTEQHLGVFYLLTRGDARQALEAVARYTHGDRFKKLPGYVTFTQPLPRRALEGISWRSRRRRTPSGVPQGLETPGFVKTFKARGVDIVHLAEFHYEDGSKLPEAERWQKLKIMHDECRRLSDDELLVLPGEEPNVHLGGHWISLFPKPVYWALNRPADKPFAEEIDGYGNVYRVGSAGRRAAIDGEGKRPDVDRASAHQVVDRLSRTRYKDTAFFPLGPFSRRGVEGDAGGPLAAHARLARARSARRHVELGRAQTSALGEVDTFRMEPDFETYGHMNINYLRLDKSAALRPRAGSRCSTRCAAGSFSSAPARC